ncbi:MAG: branched-chain amino acid ABC transporter permease [Chloroflexi bacterium]|nr:branched-chain amino acid ABC transporter permease [Chloroflexota bacterium]
MKQKILANAEIAAIVLIGFIALITGGWSVLILTVVAGALVGAAAPPNRAGVLRALIVGALTALIIVAVTFLHNAYITQLPKQDAIPVGALQPTTYGLALLLGIVVAVLVAALRAHPNKQRGRTGLLILVLFFAVIFPFFEQSVQLFWANAVIVSMIFTLQALGLNIVAGYAGLLDLGYVAFFAIGGYTIAFLNSPQFNLNVSFWLIIWIAAAAAALFGFILGAPVIPLRGDYLAIVTLGFGEIVPIVFKNLEAVKIHEPVTAIFAALFNKPEWVRCLVGCTEPVNITNGTQGITPIGRPELFGVKFMTGQYIPWYFLILAMLLLSVFFISRLRSSRIGRAWVAMREDELAATSMGVNIVRTKLTAFILGAMFSGFAGAFYGSYVSFISPDAFDFSISVIVLCMVILGGTGSITGVILGGLIIKMSDLLFLDKFQTVLGGVLQATIFQSVKSQAMTNFLESLFNASQYKLLLFGLILVLMMRFRPQGLVPSASEDAIT